MKSFCRVIGISIFKLQNAAERLMGNIPHIDRNEIQSEPISHPKKDLINIFLKFMEAEWTTEVIV